MQYNKRFNLHKMEHLLYISIAIMCVIANNGYAQNNVSISSYGSNDKSPSSVSLTLLSNITDINHQVISAKLSLNLQFLAVYFYDYSFNVYPITNELKVQSPIFTSAKRSFYVNDYAWAGNSLILSGSSKTVNDDGLPVPDRKTSELRRWTPGDKSMQVLLKDGYSIIIPDRKGEMLALFGRLDPSGKVEIDKSQITIYDMNRKSTISPITLPFAFDGSGRSYPVGWSKDSKTIYIVYSARLLSSQLIFCPVLFSVSLNGHIKQLSRAWEETHQQLHQALILNDRWAFTQLVPTDGEGELIGIVGTVEFPNLRLGYFDRHRMVKTYDVPDANIPELWKRRSKAKSLWIFTISPDGRHFIFQDTVDNVSQDRDEPIYPVYCWNFSSGELKRISQCPLIYESFGWVNQHLIFTSNSGNLGIITLDTK